VVNFLPVAGAGLFCAHGLAHSGQCIRGEIDNRVKARTRKLGLMASMSGEAQPRRQRLPRPCGLSAQIQESRQNIPMRKNRRSIRFNAAKSAIFGVAKGAGVHDSDEER